MNTTFLALYLVPWKNESLHFNLKHFFTTAKCTREITDSQTFFYIKLIKKIFIISSNYKHRD